MRRKRDGTDDGRVKRPGYTRADAGAQTPEELRANGYQPGLFGPDPAGVWSAKDALQGLKAAAEWRRQIGSGWQTLPPGKKEVYLTSVRALFGGRPALVGAADVLPGEIVGTAQDSRTLMMELNLRAQLLAAPLILPAVDLIEAGYVTPEFREQFIEGLADVIEVHVTDNESQVQPAPDEKPAGSLEELVDRIRNPQPAERYTKSLYAREILKLLILNMIFTEMLRWEWRRKSPKKARDAKARKSGYGSKADEPRVVRAQAEVDRIVAAAQLWARGERRQVVKDQLAFRGAHEADDGTVELTRTGVLNRVSTVTSIGESTLRDWLMKGYLKNVPEARKKKR